MPNNKANYIHFRNAHVETKKEKKKKKKTREKNTTFQTKETTENKGGT